MSECSDCGSGDFRTIHEDDEHTPTREKEVLRCEGCGGVGRIYRGSGATIESGVLRQ